MLEVVLKFVASGEISPADAATLFRTLIADLRQIGSGQDLTREQIGQLATASLPVMKFLAGRAFPGGSAAVATAALILSMSKPMEPGSIEEKRFFDRASGGPMAR